MPVDKLTTKATYPTGAIPPGANIVINVIGPHGDRDSAPDTGYTWKVSHNGVPLNAPQLGALVVGNVPHTFDRRDFNYRLRPEVRGSLEITLKGNGLSERWSYTIAEGAAAPAPNPADPTPVESSAPPVDDSAGPFPGLLDAVKPLHVRLARVETGLADIHAKLDVLLEK